MTATFKAVTWNVYFGTETKVLAPILAAQRKRGVGLFLMQEAGGDDITGMLEAAGLQSFTAPRQYVIAWDPDEWVRVAAGKVRLSAQPYWAQGGGNEQYSDAARAILCDREGRSLEAVSYHTPAHVQVPAGERPERRYKAMVESFRTLGHMADDSECRGFLAGGDDNWDENTGVQTADVKTVMLGSETGLRQIQAPAGTHGKRQIDDFRIKVGGGIKPVGEGWVAAGGGDHKLHGREFAWR